MTTILNGAVVLSCPFCGNDVKGPKIEEDYSDTKFGGVHVRVVIICKSCKLKMHSSWDLPEEQATEQVLTTWNRRAIEGCAGGKHDFEPTGANSDDERELRCKVCGLYRYIPFDHEDGA